MVTMQATSVVFVTHARLGATLCDAMALSHGTAHSSTAMILGPATFGTFFFRVAYVKWHGAPGSRVGAFWGRSSIHLAERYKISLRE